MLRLDTFPLADAKFTEMVIMEQDHHAGKLVDVPSLIKTIKGLVADLETTETIFEELKDSLFDLWKKNKNKKLNTMIEELGDKLESLLE